VENALKEDELREPRRAVQWTKRRVSSAKWVACRECLDYVLCGVQLAAHGFLEFLTLLTRVGVCGRSAKSSQQRLESVKTT